MTGPSIGIPGSGGGGGALRGPISNIPVLPPKELPPGTELPPGAYGPVAKPGTVDPHATVTLANIRATVGTMSTTQKVLGIVVLGVIVGAVIHLTTDDR